MRQCGCAINYHAGLRKKVSEGKLGEIFSGRPARLGAGLALVSLPAHFLLAPTASHQLAASVLALVAGIYVGFAIQDGRAKTLAVEGTFALGFVAVALAGLWVSPWAIPVAYLLHGLWDVAHHRGIDTVMPAWYVPFCAVFDWVFAADLTVAWLQR